ncbi:hypothetical protein BD311DRAFT_811931 [Dichomitus squalens]|uniref:Uncharacterized protein n=1 Tax=Dichomitus squalens TaxID=114155 RepID=A0A4V2JYP0_9APHY|nr:hypothetical protein BD311DRAFT_811931 [Dichomitus squalens]
MEVDRSPMQEHSSSFLPPPGCNVGPRGPAGDLLHHPAPQSQGPAEALHHPWHPHESLVHSMRVPAAFATPPPKDPLDRAYVRIWVDHVSKAIVPGFSTSFRRLRSTLTHYGS